MRQETDIYTKATKDIRKASGIFPAPGRLTAAVVVILLLLAACNPSPRCLENTDVYLHARFLTLDNGKDKDTTLQNVRMWGIGREDSLIVDGSAWKISLPLDAHYDSCAFVIANDTLQDTVSFHYTRSTRLLSFECGFIAEFNDLKIQITRHFLDSAAVVNPLVTNTDDENVKIYLFRD